MVQVEMGFVPAAINSSGLTFKNVAILEVDVSWALGEATATPDQVAIVISNVVVQVNFGLIVPASVDSSAWSMKMATFNVRVIGTQREGHGWFWLVFDFLFWSFFFYIIISETGFYRRKILFHSFKFYFENKAFFSKFLESWVLVLFMKKYLNRFFSNAIYFSY